ncbi:NAD-dependent succinate-semialdehyde dehydrogenase [Mycolicibacterium sp. P9-64]|uniref:NAD-dependent succinate-semialdehyde dehydrogenase n=1 Tax=Mycolicibacterium sp. P9-64 TaxID=2024612 RepID=UPI0011F02566|nr:NAD-dependent succinate-semialdehyde dehydrogenase [Mycolicibacterium sp. P9-64]KAA0083179.1 NAD-dependent succinate-semialdehyde dehydrogenase [Mycolicibacterium sp. P9-64]
MSTITTINPATGETLTTYTTMTADEINSALDVATVAQRYWSAKPFAYRADILRSAAEQLRSRAKSLALLVTREMGKPITESEAEVEKCAVGLEYYANHAQSFLADQRFDTDADHSWVSYEPVGVVLAIMPWNFPLWQVFRFAAPALMAGNAALLKHSSNTTGTAIACEDILSAAGLAPGLFTTLVVADPDVPQATERLIADARIGAVTITGSERAGSFVGSVAGREIKKSVLELGGSDPFVVLADADIPKVANLAARGRFLNGGQSCISPKRFIVEEAVAHTFTKMLVEYVAKLSVGDPEQPETQVGPLARPDLRDAIAGQVESSIAAGATLLLGGTPLTDRPGNYYSPTVLANVSAGMAVYDEETFGPVASIIAVRDADEAIAVANDTRFGLGASVWGTDVDNAISVGKQITSGACFINALVASDARMPFGGTKRSGYGRELASAGIREFVNVRTWWAMSEPLGHAPASE